MEPRPGLIGAVEAVAFVTTFLEEDGLLEANVTFEGSTSEVTLFLFNCSSYRLLFIL